MEFSNQERLDIAKLLVLNLSEEQLNSFNYMFNLNNSQLYFGNVYNKVGSGSFSNMYANDLVTYFANVIYLISFNLDSSFKSKDFLQSVSPSALNMFYGTAYFMLLLTNCICIIMNKKRDYVFSGTIYDWSISAAGSKYEQLYCTFRKVAKKNDYVIKLTFNFWDTSKTKLNRLVMDYVNVQITSTPLINPNWETNAIKQLVKVLITRNGHGNTVPNDHAQKTIVVPLNELWTNINEVVEQLTKETHWVL